MKTYLITLSFLLLGLIIQAQNKLDVEGTAKVGFPGEGNVLLDLNSDRNWVFRQVGTGANTALELVSIGGGGNKSFYITTTGRVYITDIDSTKTSSANVVRRTDGSLSLRSYKIGDLVHGGIVFWVDETGEHGLVCASTDQSASVEWGPLNNVTGAIRDNIYSGTMNTERIIINQGTNAFAADLCAEYAGGGYGDWYLPSKQELNLMYTNLHLSGIGGFASDFYWSSTEGGSSFAWLQDFGTGLQDNLSKVNVLRVRAVRTF